MIVAEFTEQDSQNLERIANFLDKIEPLLENLPAAMESVKHSPLGKMMGLK